MIQEIVIAGFGGQGVMSMGQLISYAGMLEGKHVSWLPSYGPEQRGGTANCSVVISDEHIGSPVVSHPTAAIVLNNPSFDRFEPEVVPGGVLLTNCSLIDRKTSRTDITAIEVDATSLATELGNARVANMILLGAFIGLTGIITVESVAESLKKVLGSKKLHLIEVNVRALEKGRELVENK